jgi:phosphoribosylformimino-5-aminoimidazole carboxamide ribotide isomerase
VPVLDLRGGVAVHARGRQRASYGPVSSAFGSGENPVELARAIRDALGLNMFYVADLDAIEAGVPQLQLLERLADAGLTTWVDAGIRSAGDGQALRSAGVSRVIAATETVSGQDCLAEITERLGPGCLIFGLDLRDGSPLLAPESRWNASDPMGLVEGAVVLGIKRVLVLDIARVGTGQGVGSGSLIEAVASRFPGLEIAVGGGVSDLHELRALAQCGVSSALVGSAILDGRIGRAGLLALK